MKLSNLRTALANPALAAEYALWLAQLLLRNGGPTKMIGGLVSIGGFRNFSEFYSVDKFITQGDLAYFTNMHLGPGVIMDIGANIGTISALLAKLMPDRRGYAIEPNPWVHNQLRGNLDRNGAKLFKVLPLAVSNRVGDIRFRTTRTATATARIASTNDAESSAVPCETIDYIAERLKIDSIAFLKVDVEGFEASVFQGGKGMLEAKRIEHIYFEVCPKLAESAGFAPSAASKLLEDAGYLLYRLERDGSRIPVKSAEACAREYDNWVAVARR